jgi:uncharacterized damage-inducible protein DinB
LRTKCRLRIAVIVGLSVAFGAPFHLIAQSTPASGGAQVAPAQVYGKLLGSIEAEVVEAAEAMPAEKYDFVPSTGEFKTVRTFGQQVKHLAQANYYYFSKMGSKPTADVKAIDKLTGKDEIVHALKDSFAFGHQSIDSMTAQNAFESIDSKQATRAGLATAVLAHANDHYGQMVIYLRMNGIIPPASR